MYDIDGDNKISKEEVLEAQYIYQDRMTLVSLDGFGTFVSFLARLG